MCFGRIINLCSTCDTRRVTLVRISILYTYINIQIKYQIVVFHVSIERYQWQRLLEASELSFLRAFRWYVSSEIGGKIIVHLIPNQIQLDHNQLETPHRSIMYQVIIITMLFVCLMVFNVTFSNMSVISWRSILLVEETEGPGENHRTDQFVCKENEREKNDDNSFITFLLVLIKREAYYMLNIHLIFQ